MCVYVCVKKQQQSVQYNIDFISSLKLNMKKKADWLLNDSQFSNNRVSLSSRQHRKRLPRLCRERAPRPTRLTFTHFQFDPDSAFELLDGK